MAAVAGGLNPRKFGGRDLIALLERSRHGGYYGRGTITNSSIFGVLALKTANGRSRRPSCGRSCATRRRAAASTTSPRASSPT